MIYISNLDEKKKLFHQLFTKNKLNCRLTDHDDVSFGEIILLKGTPLCGRCRYIIYRSHPAGNAVNVAAAAAAGLAIGLLAAAAAAL